MRLRILLVSADGSANEVRKGNTYGMGHGAGRVKVIQKAWFERSYGWMLQAIDS